MALDLASGAEFWCNRCCKTTPGDLEGSRGKVLAVSYVFGKDYRGRKGQNRFSIVAKAGYVSPLGPKTASPIGSASTGPSVVEGRATEVGARGAPLLWTVAHDGQTQSLGSLEHTPPQVFWAGFRVVFLCFWTVFGQSWAQARAQRPRFKKRYLYQRKLTRGIDSTPTQVGHGVLDLCFWVTKLPRGPGKPFQKVRGEAPHHLERFPGPPGQLRTRKRRFRKPCPTLCGVCSNLLNLIPREPPGRVGGSRRHKNVP
jgi:hypothetical protein